MREKKGTSTQMSGCEPDLWAAIESATMWLKRPPSPKRGCLIHPHAATRILSHSTFSSCMASQLMLSMSYNHGVTVS